MCRNNEVHASTKPVQINYTGRASFHTARLVLEFPFTLPQFISTESSAGYFLPRYQKRE